MRAILLLFILIKSLNAFAQFKTSPYFNAIGGSGVAVASVWSAQSNPAGLAGLKASNIALAYEKSTFNADISKKSGVFNLPVGDFVIGANINVFGVKEFSQTKAGLSIAKAFGEELKLGFGADYHQLNITNYGKDQLFTIAAGLQYQFTKSLNFGLFINNPIGTSFNQNASRLTAFTVETGINYTLSDKVFVNTSITKEQFQKVAFNSGLQYKPIKNLAFRGGISLNPLQQHVGFGLFLKDFTIDFTVNVHQVLDYSPQIALNYAF